MSLFKILSFLLLLLPGYATAQKPCSCREAITINVNGVDTCVHVLKFGRLQTSAFSYCHHIFEGRDSAESLNKHFDKLYIHCNSGDTTTDEIIKKIEAGQPTQYFRIDTLTDANSAPIYLPKEKCEQINVSVTILGKQEVTLISGTDYFFNCQTYELKIINNAILDSGIIIKVNWFYSNCITDN